MSAEVSPHVRCCACANPSGVSHSISFRLKSLFCLAMYPFTGAYASSVGLSSQWTTGRHRTVCPCCLLLRLSSIVELVDAGIPFQ